MGDFSGGSSGGCSAREGGSVEFSPVLSDFFSGSLPHPNRPRKEIAAMTKSGGIAMVDLLSDYILMKRY
jgi:hypothetical protein